MKSLLKDKKNVVISLLGALTLIMVPREGLLFFLWVLGGVFLCAAFDSLFHQIVLKNKIIPKSAIITGFIVAGIIDYHQPVWILVVFSILAVLSKHLIKYKKKHIFNPANFSLFFATIFKIPLTWHIESNIYLIIAVGLYLAYVFKKIPHILSFIIFSAGLFVLEKLNLFSILSFFFIFIMLIEPKTSGFGILRGFIFGGIAGIFSFISFKFFSGYDFFVISLFIANAFNPLICRIKKVKFQGEIVE